MYTKKLPRTDTANSPYTFTVSRCIELVYDETRCSYTIEWSINSAVARLYSPRAFSTEQEALDWATNVEARLSEALESPPYNT